MKNKKIITMEQLKYRKAENNAIEKALVKYCDQLEESNVFLSEKEKEVIRKDFRKILREDHSKRIKAGIQHRKRIR